MDKIRITIAASTVVTCSQCGKESEDVSRNPHAWDGWNFWLGGRSCADCFDAKEAANLKESEKVPA